MLGQGKGVRTVMSDPFLRPEDPELYSQTAASFGASCPRPQFLPFLPSHLGTSKPSDGNFSCFSQVLFPPVSVVPGIPSGNGQELSPHTYTSRQLLSVFSKVRRCLSSQFKDLGPTAELWERWREGEITGGKRRDSEQTGRQLILPWESPCTPVRTEGLLSVPGHLTSLSSSSCASVGEAEVARKAPATLRMSHMKSSVFPEQRQDPVEASKATDTLREWLHPGGAWRGMWTQHSC